MLSNNKLRFYRNKEGITQLDLSERTMVPRCAIQFCEQFGKQPRHLYKKAIAEYFKVKIEDIFPRQ